MKKTFFLLLLIIPFFISCSNDDKNSEPVPTELFGTFFPSEGDGIVKSLYFKDNRRCWTVEIYANEVPLRASYAYDYDRNLNKVTLYDRNQDIVGVGYLYDDVLRINIYDIDYTFIKVNN